MAAAVQFSSATAFLARAVGPAAEPEAQRLFATLDLDPETRALAEVQALPADRRLAALAARTGDAWSAARLAHAEARALVVIRRQLQQHGRWRA